jgi:uncharacterized integral membrane protein
MIEQLLLYGVRILPSILICFVGIAAFKYGLQRFGVKFKLPLIIVFISLWVSGTLIDFLFSETASRIITFIALPVFLVGSLFWLISLIFRHKKKQGG